MMRWWMWLISWNQSLHFYEAFSLAIQFSPPHSISLIWAPIMEAVTHLATVSDLFCLPRWQMRQIDGLLHRGCACTCVWLWSCVFMRPLSGLTGLILKRCRLTDASWKIIQRWSCRSEEWNNGRFRIPFIKPSTWSCALCVYLTCQRFTYTVCVQGTWPLGNFTSKSWCANKCKRRSVTITTWRFHPAGQFSAFDWAPGWTFSWFLFSVVVLVHLF